MFFSRTDDSATAADHPLPPLTWPERVGAGLLLAATITVGVNPSLLLHWIIPGLTSPGLQAIWTGGTP